MAKKQKAVLHAVFNPEYLVFGIRFKEIKLIASQEKRRKVAHMYTHNTSS